MIEDGSYLRGVSVAQELPEFFGLFLFEFRYELLYVQFIFAFD